MAKIEISTETASDIIDVLAEVSELLQDYGISLHTPKESSLQKRMGDISEKIFYKWMRSDRGKK